MLYANEARKMAKEIKISYGNEKLAVLESISNRVKEIIVESKGENNTMHTNEQFSDEVLRELAIMGYEVNKMARLGGTHYVISW